MNQKNIKERWFRTHEITPYVDYDEDGVDSTRVFAEFTGSSLFTTEKIRHFDEKSLFGGCVSIFEASERI